MSYQKRYLSEKRDYYLELAMFARIQTKGFPAIQKLLTYLRGCGDSVWNKVESQRTEKIEFEEAFLSSPDKQLGNNIISKPEGISKEDEILELLRELIKKGNDKETVIKKANEILMVKPNFMGMGIDVNALFEKLFIKKME